MELLGFWLFPILGLVFLICRMLYRLTLHPLAKFPGPRLAAITSMYGASFDLPFASSYCKQFVTLHDRYGPIVRIEPNHLHVRDLNAYNQIFKVGTQYAKAPTFYNLPFVDGSFYNERETKDANTHKDIYQSYFSRGAVQSLETRLRTHLDKFLQKLDAASVSSQVVNLSLGFRCLASDIVMDYCYDRPFGALDALGFRFPAIVDLEEFLNIFTATWYFPRVFNVLFGLLHYLPRSWARLIKPMAATFEIQDEIEQRVRRLQEESEKSTKTSIFQTVLRPDINQGHFTPSLPALYADGFLFFGAGTDTIAHTLTLGIWHLLNNPPKLETLRKELRQAGVSRGTMHIGWAGLEKLHYLRAVVKESLRLSHGIPGKLPRIVPPPGVTLCAQQIPSGTIVSSSHYVYHMSDEYFDEPFMFKPERWLNPKEFAQLDNYLLSFSKGSRGCLGINLAYAELYNTFAYLLQSFNLELAGTTPHDMDWHDAFAPATFGHLQVRVTARKE